ncbi:MAG: hypothetical protein P8Y12_08450 [Gammaproteobacteria bacterium]
MILIWHRLLFVFLLATTLAACASRPPSDRENLCTIYKQKPGWYADSLKAAKRWNGPLDVPMAIMAQESSFRANAKPPIRFFLGVIPYGRASDAFGYPQALDSTWSRYRSEAGNVFSQRDNFDDSIDFIQWYMHTSWVQNGVDKNDAFAQYLNYHEGQGGYKRGTWKKKKWLIKTARLVEQRTQRYRSQLAVCKPELDKKAKGWSIF